MFIRSVAQFWGTLVTGGLIMGCLGLWQGTKHPVPSFIYWIIGIGAFFLACFKAWNEKLDLLENQIIPAPESGLLIEQKPHPKT
jgi:hypothetical protein